MSKVIVLKTDNPIKGAIKALEEINAKENITKSSILIKPNYITARVPSTGITTDSRVIEGIIQYLQLNKMNDIIIGEGSGDCDTFLAYKVSGIYELGNKYNVKLIDLNKDEFIDVKVKEPLIINSYKLAKNIITNSIISVPKLKPHRLATVTLSIKNLMGALANKGIAHKHIHKKLVDLYSVIKPDLAVIDAIIAGEGNEKGAMPVEMNLIIAGTDLVAVDSVGSYLMGINPKNVGHLVLAEKKRFGVSNLKNIEIIGEDIDKVKRTFIRTN